MSCTRVLGQPASATTGRETVLREAVEVRVAGLHGIHIQLHEVVLYTAGFRSREELFPVDDTLADRDLFLVGRGPVLQMERDEAPRVLREIGRGLVPETDH